MGKSIQIYWRRSNSGREFGFPVTRMTSHVLLEGEVVEYPKSVALIFPGGSTQLHICPKEGQDFVLAGLDRDFLQMTATLWLFYMVSLGEKTFPSLGFAEGVVSQGEMEQLFDSIHKFLEHEDEGKTDEAR